MKTKKVLRYYCDFCDKSGCNSGHIKTHESKCCRNPSRKCPVCVDAGLVQKSITDLVIAWSALGLKGLEDAADRCPACMLSAILQSAEKDDLWVGWDYKEAMDSFMGELRSFDV